MSVEALTWALALPEQPQGQWLTLIIMANAADEYGLLRRSVPALADRLPVSERSIRKHLRQAEEDGLLRRVPLAQDDGWQVENLYVLAMAGTQAWQAGRLRALQDVLEAAMGSPADPAQSAEDIVGIMGSPADPAGPSMYSINTDTDIHHIDKQHTKGAADIAPPPAAPEEWMWAAMLDQGMVTTSHQLLAKRRQKLRALYDEHLKALPKGDRPAAFEAICQAVRTRPWWKDNPGTWVPDKCFNNPTNREEHVQWARGQHPDQGGKGAGSGANGKGSFQTEPGSIYGGKRYQPPTAH